MKKLASIVLVLMLVAVNPVFASSGALPVSALGGTPAAEPLYASRAGFDNGDVSLLLTETTFAPGDADGSGTADARDVLMLRRHLAEINQMTEEQSARGDTDCDGYINARDILHIRKKEVLGADYALPYAAAGNVTTAYSYGAAALTAESDSFSVRLKIDNTAKELTGDIYIAFDYTMSRAEALTITASPVYEGRESGCLGHGEAIRRQTAGRAVMHISSDPDLQFAAVMLTFSGSGLEGAKLYIPEIFVCANEYSAQWISENRLDESSSVTAENLTVSLESEKTAIRLLNMTSDDKNHTNGGIYHDFKNTKWPSIAVDENDKLYLVASGLRMAHVDPFGATVLATSTDGGVTWSKPKTISDTILDDRDAGITYLGNGKMLVSYFTGDGEQYLPGGTAYTSLRSYANGGSAPDWAATWDYAGNPVGGIIGTYLQILDKMNRDAGYDTTAGSYLIKSTDYGETWDVDAYTPNLSDYTYTMETMLNNYGYDYTGSRVPVTSCHGPLAMSDGTVLYAGKVMDSTDLPTDAMAAYISCDEGATWEYLSEIPLPAGYERNNFHELSVTETADGALLCAMRAQPTDSINISPELTVYTCHSYDGGKTWTVPAPTGLEGAPPHLVTMENGDIVMTTGYRTNPRCIYAAVSTDGGRTWSNQEKVSGSFLNNDDMGYPASAVLSDGTICTAYYGTYHTSSANEGYSSILSTRWTYTISGNR